MRVHIKSHPFLVFKLTNKENSLTNTNKHFPTNYIIKHVDKNVKQKSMSNYHDIFCRNENITLEPN